MAGDHRRRHRRRLLLLLGLAIVAALAIGGFVWRRGQPSGPPDPRLVQIQQFLDTTQSTQPWYPAITRLELKSGKLYVHTNLPGRNMATPINEAPDFQVTRQMYETLWKFANMDHPSWRIGWVYIMSRYGTYIDGGAA